jgi:hypothetical protein
MVALGEIQLTFAGIISLIQIKILLIILLGMLFYYLVFKKLYNTNTSAKKNMVSKYSDILGQKAGNLGFIKASEVNQILNKASELGCLKEFKTWLLKQNISPGVRVKVENYYDLHSKKILGVMSFDCKICNTNWGTNADRTSLFVPAFQNDIWSKTSSPLHKDCCPLCCKSCWERVEGD